MTLPFKEDWATTDSAADHAAGHNDVVTVLNDLFNHKNVLLASQYVDPANTPAQNDTGMTSLIGDMGVGTCVLWHPGDYEFASAINLSGTLKGMSWLGLGHVGKDPNGAKAGVNLIFDSASADSFVTFNESGGLVPEGPKFSNLNFTVKTPGTQKEVHTLLHIYNCNHWRVEGCSFAYGNIGLLINRAASPGDNAYWQVRDCHFHSNATAIDMDTTFAPFSGIVDSCVVIATSQLTSLDTRTGIKVGSSEVELRHIKVHEYGTGIHWTAGPWATDVRYERTTATGTYTAFKVDGDEGTIIKPLVNYESGATGTGLNVTGNRNLIIGGDLITSSINLVNDTPVNDTGTDNMLFTKGYVAGLGDSVGTGNEGNRPILSVAIGRKAGVPSDSDFPLGAPPVGTLILDTTNGRLYVNRGSNDWDYASLT